MTDRDHNPPADDRAETRQAAEFDAMLVGTFALMTAWAMNLRECGRSQQQAGLVARKIVSNLSAMTVHPRACGCMSDVLERVGRHWQTVADALEDSGELADAAGPAIRFRPPAPATA